MELKFQTERWPEFWPDAQSLFRRHWEEIALDKDRIAYSLDEPKYRAMDEAGILHVLAARTEGRLIGYYLAFLLPHPHYSQAGLMGFTDIYFLAPEFRRGTHGARLFLEAERTLRARGATKIYTSCKVAHDISPLLAALGWRFSDKMFTKVF